jgi:quercetin dioxygenase-like cupin family protein
MNIEELIENNKVLESYGNGESIVETPHALLTHDFADQLYIRRMDMVAGSVVVGAIHNHKHVWFLLTGKLSIYSNGKLEDYVAPCYVVSEPGTKRLIYAHEQSIFVNVHKNPSNTENLEELEKEIVSFTEKDFKNYKNK